jgi:hypothetical protein
MKVKTPCMCEEAHGALGGVEFKTGNYGNVVSRRSISSYGQSPKQLLHRSRLKLAQAAWSALNPGLQAAWNEYARAPLTGRNAFVGAALRNLTIGFATPSQSPLFSVQLAKPKKFLIYQQPYALKNASVNWSASPGSPHWLLIYKKNTPGPTHANSKKLVYVGHALGTQTYYSLGTPAPAKYTTLLVIVWDPVHGVEIEKHGCHVTWYTQSVYNGVYF